MPDTPAHRAAMTGLARQRAAQGLPKWRFTVRLGDLTARRDAHQLCWAEFAQGVARRVAASGWARAADRDTDLDDLLDEMADCEVNTDARYLYDRLYDLADYDRVRLDTTAPPLGRRPTMSTEVELRLRRAEAAQGDAPQQVMRAAAAALRPGRAGTVRWWAEPHTAPAGHPVRRLHRHSGLPEDAAGELRCVWHADGAPVTWGEAEADRLLPHYLALTYKLSGRVTALADDELERFVTAAAPALAQWEVWIHDPVRDQRYPWHPFPGYLRWTLAPEDGGPDRPTHTSA